MALTLRSKKFKLRAICVQPFWKLLGLASSPQASIHHMPGSDHPYPPVSPCARGWASKSAGMHLGAKVADPPFCPLSASCRLPSSVSNSKVPSSPRYKIQAVPQSGLPATPQSGPSAAPFPSPRMTAAISFTSTQRRITRRKRLLALAPAQSREMALAPAQSQERAPVPKFDPEKTPFPESSSERASVPKSSQERATVPLLSPDRATDPKSSPP